MKQVVMALTGGSFLLLMIFGGLAFKNPKRFAYFAVAAMLLFTGGTIYLGIMENSQLTPGGWTKPGDS